MRKKTQSISILSALTLASMLTLGGCAPEKVKHTFSLGTVEKIESLVYNDKDLSDVKIVGDFAYIKNSEGDIFSVNLKTEGLKALNKKDNWKKLELKDDQKDNKASQAKLATYEREVRQRAIYATAKGIVVTTKLLTTAADKADFETKLTAIAPCGIYLAANPGRFDAAVWAPGCSADPLTVALLRSLQAFAYFEGAAVKPTLAWTNEADHVDSGAIAPDQEFENIHAFTKGDKQYLAVKLGTSVATPAKDNLITVLELSKDAKFKGEFKSGAQPSISVAAPAVRGTGTVVAGGPFHGDKMANDDSKLYVLTVSGITSLDLQALADGTSGNSSDITAGSAQDADKWKIDQTAVNYNVQYVKLHEGKLYIALSAGAKSKGGIAVYDTKAESIVAPSVEWSEVAVSDLNIYKSKLWALVFGSLVEIKDDGKMAENKLALANFSTDAFKSSKVTIFKEDLNGKTLYTGDLLALGGNQKIDKLVPFGDKADYVLTTSGKHHVIVTHEEKTIEVEKTEAAK